MSTETTTPAEVQDDDECDVCANDGDECRSCDGQGQDDWGDRCHGCGGSGWAIPEHCCDCGGSPYCNHCRKCGRCVAICGCPVEVRMSDGSVKTL